MPCIQIALCSHRDEAGEPVRIEALDLPTALTIADINVPFGEAEIWQHGRLLGRLIKHGGRHGTFWEIGR